MNGETITDKTILTSKPCMVFKRNSSGKIYHIGWYRPEDGSWYFLGSDGAMLKGQFLERQDKWYYLDETEAMASKPITLTPDQEGRCSSRGWQNKKYGGPPIWKFANVVNDNDLTTLHRF